jgi:hypothetical protein
LAELAVANPFTVYSPIFIACCVDANATTAPYSMDLDALNDIAMLSDHRILPCEPIHVCLPIMGAARNDSGANESL